MATTIFYEIPLNGNAQQFYITLAGVTYRMLLMWRESLWGGWFLDINDLSNNPLVQGIPLVTGADLLEQYPDLNIGGSMYVVSDGDPDATPTFDNLGTTSHLYFAVTS